MRRIAVFLVKLSAATSVDHYDQITKAVYLGNMQAERKATPLRKTGRKANQGHEANRLISGSQAVLIGAWAVGKGSGSPAPVVKN